MVGVEEVVSVTSDVCNALTCTDNPPVGRLPNPLFDSDDVLSSDDVSVVVHAVLAPNPNLPADLLTA